jgi:hypothetical protein
VVGRIVEVAIIDKPYEYTDDSDDFCQHVTEVVEFLFERRSFRYL